MDPSEQTSSKPVDGGDDISDDEQDEVTGDDSGKKPLSKKEKDALKKQKKKEKEKAAKASGAAKKGTDGGDGKTKKSGMGDLIKEHLKKQQEEEERRRAIEEAEERRLAELAAAREEKARLERERKDREKQKKKDRIARQKADGTYMTAEEKAKRRKAQEQLELMKAQGMVVLGADGTSLASKPKYGKPKKVKEENVTVTEASKDDDASADDDDDRTSSDGSDVADDWAADADTATKVRSPSDTNGTVVASHEASPPTAAVASVVNHQSSTSSCVIDDNNTSSMRPAVVLDDVDERAPPNETREQQRERIKTRLRLRAEKALALRDLNDLRSPVICVLGHVDTGKTKMLDRIRRTHVQDGEAGGITQQIGATEVPASAIIAQTTHVKHFKASTMHLPGFLVIDTPGHESFRNLRSRGSNLCDVAILIVDIMHGLEPQTIESIEMLKQRQCPFVVGLNKIDRLYEWKTNDKKDVRDLIAMQLPNTQLEFNERVAEVKLQFAQKCALNVCLYWENDGTGEYISMVPTSAVTGDGVGNLMAYLAMYAQENLRERIAFNEHLDCTVLEVKSMAGLGTTIDVVLVNGRLHYGDTIVLAGTDGAITTQIRELLMPEPLKEMRVKNPYRHFKEVRGAYGVKVLAKDLDKALAGLPLLVAVKDDEIELLQEEVTAQLTQALKAFKTKSVGVYVQASTLGSLEALLEFLRTEKIPYCGINIGPVHKKDVMKASTMLEHDAQWAVILAFDVKIEKDAQTMADELGVRIFRADIIYHLQDAFIKHRQELVEKERKAHAHLAIFPCRLRVLPAHMFKTRDPIICGVSVEAGCLRVGTPLCVPSRERIALGTVSSIEVNNKPVDSVRIGQEACIKIENTTGEAPRMFDRHFTAEDAIVSRVRVRVRMHTPPSLLQISRESIDVCKQYFRDDLTKPDWALVVELKKVLDIM